MTQQDAFEGVIRHLQRQRRRSVGGGGLIPVTIYCLYRGPNHTSCAVGCLIPDALYTEELEDMNLADIFTGVEDLRRFAVTPAVMRVSDYLRTNFPYLDLLRALQMVHDHAENWSDTGLNDTGWKMLTAIAVAYGLTLPAREVR